MLYAGAFFLVASTVTRDSSYVLDGVMLAIVAVALVALGGRLFPDFAPTTAAGRALPAVVERLSWPIGYWNGLAMLVALALPPLLRNAAGTRSPLARAAAVAAIPPIVADIYLASSRGGAVVGLVAVAMFVVLSRDRLPRRGRSGRRDDRRCRGGAGARVTVPCSSTGRSTRTRRASRGVR